MAYRGWIKRLEREARGEMIEITQKDGRSARFSATAGMDAYLNLMQRMGAGEDAPPEHPLLEAARNSSDPKWSEGIYAAGDDPAEWIKPIPDLSEGAEK